MRLPDFHRVFEEKFEAFAEQLNRLFEYITDAFNSNIALNNLKIQEIEFQANSLNEVTVFPLKVQKKKTNHVRHVVIGQILWPTGSTPAVTSMIWHEEDKYISIDNILGLTTDICTIRLLAFYEE